MTKHFSAIEFKGEGDDPAGIVTKALDDLTKSVDDRLKVIESKGVDPKLLERLDKIEAKQNRPTGGAVASELELKAVNDALRSGAAISGLEVKNLTIGGSPATGGDLVAPAYLAQIIQKLVQFSPVRQYANVLSIGSGSVIMPVENAALVPTWVSETGDRTEDEPTFTSAEFNAFECAAIVPVSRQLLEDSMVDLASYISSHAAQQFGKDEGKQFIRGDANGKPTGILYDPNVFGQVLTKQDGTNLIKNLITMCYSLPGAYAANAVWMMRRETMGVIRAAADAANQSTLWSDSLANGTPATFLGRPVVDAPDMDVMTGTGSPVAATYPVLFGDLNAGYQIVDRVGLQIMRDDYTGANKGLVKFHARRRTGGKVRLAEAVKVLKATVSGS